MVELMSMVCEKLYCAALACLLSSYKSMAMFRLYLTAPRVWHVVSSRMVPLQSRRYGSSKQSLNKARFADVVSGPGPPDSTIAASTSSRRDLTSAKVLSVLAASSPKILGAEQSRRPSDMANALFRFLSTSRNNLAVFALAVAAMTNGFALALDFAFETPAPLLAAAPLGAADIEPPLPSTLPLGRLIWIKDPADSSVSRFHVLWAFSTWTCSTQRPS